MYGDTMIRGGSIIIEGNKCKIKRKYFFTDLYELFFPEKKKEIYNLIEIVIY
jgi:hypothetical protein